MSLRPFPVLSPSLRLGIISFLSLYFELVLIRWLPAEIRILAYFTNLTLISCVLGLGVGAIIAQRKAMPASTFPALLALIVLPAQFYIGFSLPMPLSSEGYFIWNGLSNVPGSVYQYPLMFGFFIFNSFVFVPLGQMLGKEFERLAPLRAYTVNVFGALVGVGVFALFCLFHTPPWLWIVCGGSLYLTLVRIDRPVLVASLFLLAVSVLMREPSTYWSPYYKITTSPIPMMKSVNSVGPEKAGVLGTSVVVNTDSHQQALDLSGKHDDIVEYKTRRLIYDFPYTFARNDKVLIFGAGTGNDVAAALRAGAQHIDAVEIDPVILSLGRELHPEHPYADSRVTVHVQDARTFLRASDEQFDKIVLGYVDSHTLFSAMSSVRLDNFIYTREFFAEMKRHLRENGILSVTFTIHERWIADRLYGLMRETFGSPPLVFQGRLTSSMGTVFLGSVSPLAPASNFTTFNPRGDSTGEGWRETWSYTLREDGYLRPSSFSSTALVPTDDWPYLYLRDKTVPFNYYGCLLVLLLFSYVFVRGASRTSSIKWHFFFLGAGFLVLETKAMTELAVFLGSTWTVNSFVIATILCLILLANWFVAKGWLIGQNKMYSLLIGSLVVSYFAPLQRLLAWNSGLRNWVAAFVLCMPMFFAGLIFARLLQNETNSASALGSNLLGAVLGGMVEYASMAFGLKSLYLFATLFYLASYVFAVKRSSERAGAPEKPTVMLAANGN